MSTASKPCTLDPLSVETSSVCSHLRYLFDLSGSRLNDIFSLGIVLLHLMILQSHIEWLDGSEES